MKIVLFGSRFLRSQHEENLSALVHAFGLGIACAMSVALAVLGLQRDTAHLFAGLSYGISHVVIYASSVLYHFTESPPLKTRLRAFDQAAIYAAIAGTYTPLVMFGFSPPWSLFLTCITWMTCAWGIFRRLRAWRGDDTWSLVSYLSLVLAGAVIFFFSTAEPFLASREILVSSGCCFLLGFVFYSWHYKPYFHTVWHFFTVLGNILHFYAVWTYFMQSAHG